MLHDTIDALFADHPDGVVYDQLTERDQRRLSCAYILDDPEIVFDLLADIPPLHLANSLAVAALTGNCNGRQLSRVVSAAVFPNKTLADLIQKEIDVRYLAWTQYRQYEVTA